MYWVITIMLMFHGSETTLEREYLEKTFTDDFSCHEFVYNNKIKFDYYNRRHMWYCKECELAIRYPSGRELDEFMNS